MLRATIAGLSVTSFAVSANAPLPSGEDRINHATEGLAPYGLMPSAQGELIGNIPTFRCDDGTLLDVSDVGPELNKGGIMPHFGKEFTRMKSRQTYAYGVLYHLTGDKQALALTKQGTYYIIDQLENKQNDGVGLEPKRTKAFYWGNGYHQFEHALIGYLYAQQVAAKPETLYYARTVKCQWNRITTKGM